MKKAEPSGRKGFFVGDLIRSNAPEGPCGPIFEIASLSSVEDRLYAKCLDQQGRRCVFQATEEDPSEDALLPGHWAHFTLASGVSAPVEAN